MHAAYTFNDNAMVINVHTDLHCEHIQLSMHYHVLCVVCSCDALVVALYICTR